MNKYQYQILQNTVIYIYPWTYELCPDKIITPKLPIHYQKSSKKFSKDFKIIQAFHHSKSLEKNNRGFLSSEGKGQF